MQDASEITWDYNERRLSQREHAGESEDQVQTNKRDGHKGGNSRQRWSPARQNAEIRQRRCECERDGDCESAKVTRACLRRI